MKIREAKKLKEIILKEIHKVIVNQEKVIEELLIALFSKGHVLVIGVPGLAKTLLINTIAKTLGLKFSRIQFTPDLMPSDITGTEILQEDPLTKEKKFKFVKGPIFANILLADEINRTPPKTQSALLEAMQELKVTVNGVDYFLEEPFFVFATQNPIEQEGTYPLPEAQLDRFMLNTYIYYPDHNNEIEIVKRTTGYEFPQPQKVLEKEEIIEIQKEVREMPVPEHVFEYAIKLVRNTRPESTEFEKVKKYVDYGASPRASQFLIIGGKAKAFLDGKDFVEIKDVKYIAPSVLRHRIIFNFAAEAEEINKEEFIKEIIENTDWEKK
uniref:MoxR family ATPase n=1 Tax=candidate division WOR-3 bacterium TaxID=2052148 RepID=A0A7V4E2D2_UNCW3